MTVSQLCSKCFAPIGDGVAFCISCGAKVEIAASSDTGQGFVEQAYVPAPLSPQNRFAGFQAKLPAGLARLASREGWRKKASVVAAVAITAALAGAFVGGRSSIDQDAIRVNGYRAGYDEGFRIGVARGEEEGYSRGSSDGYDSGYSAGDSAGFSRGRRQGCRDAFVFVDGTFLHITPYAPSGFRRYPGRYYKSSSGC